MFRNRWKKEVALPTCGALHGDHSLQRQSRGWKMQWGERQPACAEVSILGRRSDGNFMGWFHLAMAKKETFSDMS